MNLNFLRNVDKKEVDFFVTVDNKPWFAVEVKISDTSVSPHLHYYREKLMRSKMTLIYWKGEKFWLGKLLEHPEIMTQGETLEELEDNIKDAYLMMAMEDVPQEYKLKKIAI